MDIEKYQTIEVQRVSRLYGEKHKAGFLTKEGFVSWYCQQLKEQDCRCYYCGTSIFDIQKLITAGVVKTRRVRGNGSRGGVLEIDKVINSIGYHPSNCVLSCYYCNNDKSYTMDGDSYKEHFGANRGKFFSNAMLTLELGKSIDNKE
jgi:hypothetical protein